MTDGFHADVEALTTQAGRFGGLADRAAAIHRELTDTLTGLGPCWGDDAVGQSFGAAHVAPADGTLTAIGALPDRIGGVGTRFAGTARAYHEQDASGAGTITAADG
jgi:uncharacterized protein YukE